LALRNGSAALSPRPYTLGVAEVRPLMEVENALEGEDICERLRAAGIKCAVEPLHVAQMTASRFATGRDAMAVLVFEPDLDRARAVVDAFEAETAAHRVSVCETRPVGDDAGDIGTGYEAVCGCDWTGPFRETSGEARKDAYAHSKNVATEIVRPG
jgi:hypothetical protein